MGMTDRELADYYREEMEMWRESAKRWRMHWHIVVIGVPLLHWLAHKFLGT